MFLLYTGLQKIQAPTQALFEKNQLLSYGFCYKSFTFFGGKEEEFQRTKI